MARTKAQLEEQLEMRDRMIVAMQLELLAARASRDRLQAELRERCPDPLEHAMVLRQLFQNEHQIRCGVRGES